MPADFRLQVRVLVKRYSDAPEKLQYQLTELLTTGRSIALEDSYGRFLLAWEAAK